MKLVGAFSAAVPTAKNATDSTNISKTRVPDNKTKQRKRVPYELAVRLIAVATVETALIVDVGAII